MTLLHASPAAPRSGVAIPARAAAAGPARLGLALAALVAVAALAPNLAWPAVPEAPSAEAGAVPVTAPMGDDR